MAHTALVRGWFEAGVDVVVAHGPFFESATYDDLFATTPVGATNLHLLLRVSYDVALARVLADADRTPTAMSRDPSFLRSAYDAFVERELPPADVEIDTDDLAPDAVAEIVVRALGA